LSSSVGGPSKARISFSLLPVNRTGGALGGAGAGEAAAASVAAGEGAGGIAAASVAAEEGSGVLGLALSTEVALGLATGLAVATLRPCGVGGEERARDRSSLIGRGCSHPPALNSVRPVATARIALIVDLLPTVEATECANFFAEAGYARILNRPTLAVC